MPQMNFHPESLSNTYEGENTVWTQLQASLERKDGDSFYRLPILDAEGHFLFEPDIVVVLRGRVPIVIECKGCRLTDIVSVNGAVWTMGDSWYRAREKPLNQARDQAIALANMLAANDARVPVVHNLVVLPFISRLGWEQRFGPLSITAGILFADDIALPERFAARILETVSDTQVDPARWNRLAMVLGARDRWIDERGRPSPTLSLPPPPARVPQAEAISDTPLQPGITIIHYAGRPPSAEEVRREVGIGADTPYTYLVATAALERKRGREDLLGGQHQLKKQLREDAAEPEAMQLLFHKALRHFIAKQLLTRTEERVLIQRAILTLAEGNRMLAEQLRQDAFAWRKVLAEIEEEGIDLCMGGSEIQWAHPELEHIGASLQSIYRCSRENDDGITKPTFEEAARRYLETAYVPTPVVVMEGFTRLTPLQQDFIRHCATVEGVRLCLILPHNPVQQAGFAALDRTYAPFVEHATHRILETSGLGESDSLVHLQSGLFSSGATPCKFSDDKVSMTAYSHRNDEAAACVREIIRLLDHEGLSFDDIVVVCSDPQGVEPLLREEAELCGCPDLFALPPRQLLLTPVGRFILVLYEVWKTGTLEMQPEQLSVLLASGWLGGHAQESAELFVAVSHQHFSFCRSEQAWRDAFDSLERELEEGNAVLGTLAERLPSSLVSADELAAWRTALDMVLRLCERIFASGEKPIGEHISILLGEIASLDPHPMLQTERQVLADIRAAMAELAESRSLAIDAHEFGEVLGSLIREREDDQDGDLPGSTPGGRSRQVWVVGPEGVDNIERHTVFFLGVDDSRMPVPGSPPWPRTAWSAQEHVERQRYRFLAVVRAARQRLLLSYARQDWEKQYQPSPYLDEAAYLLDRSINMEVTAVRPPAPQPASCAVPRQLRRERYTLSELASYRLCPYRFKMETLTTWARRYTEPWQLEFLAQGVWLAEVFHHVATQAPGRNPPDAFARMIEAAIDEVWPRVQARLPGLRRLAWTGVERQVRSTIGHLLRPTAARKLVGIAVPDQRGKTREIPVGARQVRVAAEADFQELREGHAYFLKEVNQSGQWLMFGKNDQPASKEADDDPYLFKALYPAVKWWRGMMFEMTKYTNTLEPDVMIDLINGVQNLEGGSFRKNPGDHCRYCPVFDTCMGLRP